MLCGRWGFGGNTPAQPIQNNQPILRGALLPPKLFCYFFELQKSRSNLAKSYKTLYTKITLKTLKSAIILACVTKKDPEALEGSR